MSFLRTNTFLVLSHLGHLQTKYTNLHFGFREIGIIRTWIQGYCTIFLACCQYYFFIFYLYISSSFIYIRHYPRHPLRHPWRSASQTAIHAPKNNRFAEGRHRRRICTRLSLPESSCGAGERAMWYKIRPLSHRKRCQLPRRGSLTFMQCVVLKSRKSLNSFVAFLWGHALRVRKYFFAEF